MRFLKSGLGQVLQQTILVRTKNYDISLGLLGTTRWVLWVIVQRVFGHKLFLNVLYSRADESLKVCGMNK